MEIEKKQKGKVWLAGAGPGDAGLLTVKALHLIRTADVIVYDALISAEILSQIPKETETVYVGKRAGHHTVPQDEINRILLNEALEGKQVLRLKGGDPFVFGRGGEELELLREHGIPFEIIPGITSSVAVPAYAGIPVTHRDFTSSFHVITGHARKDGTLNIDFDSLVRLGGTLVFLMGVGSMEQIMNGLTDAGMDPETPAAVLEKGTTSGQRRVTATVSTLKQKADEAEIAAPAVIVVGKVCSLSGEFHWAEERPLGQRQFLLTRPRQHMSVLAQRLRNLGAQVIEMPAIHTEPLRPNPRLADALQRFCSLETGRWLVFTSPVGAAVFWDTIKEQRTDIRQIFGSSGKVRIGAIGSATARALEDHGLIPDAVPEVYSAQTLGEAIAKQSQSGEYVLIVRAENGSADLIPPLEQAGLQVEDVPLYRTVYEINPLLEEKVCNMLRGGEIDAVTFTSGSTVRGFVSALKEKNPDYRKIRAVCIGNQTARAAADYGMQTETAARADMDAMVEKIVELFGTDGTEKQPV